MKKILQKIVDTCKKWDKWITGKMLDRAYKMAVAVFILMRKEPSDAMVVDKFLQQSAIVFRGDYNIELFLSADISIRPYYYAEHTDEIHRILYIINNEDSIWIVYKNYTYWLEMYFAIHGFDYVANWHETVPNVSQYISESTIIEHLLNGCNFDAFIYLLKNRSIDLRYSKKIIWFVVSDEFAEYVPDMVKLTYASNDIEEQCHITIHFAYGF